MRSRPQSGKSAKDTVIQAAKAGQTVRPRRILIARIRCWHCGALSVPTRLDGTFKACGGCGHGLFYMPKKRRLADGRGHNHAGSLGVPGGGVGAEVGA